MKPTPQISSNRQPSQVNDRALDNHRRFPATDYNFQSNVATAGAPVISGATHDISDLRAFRKISREFLGMETARDYIGESLSFVLIMGASALALISVIVAITRMVRNY